MVIDFKEAFTFMFKQENFLKKYITGAFFVFLSSLPIFLNYGNIMTGETVLSMGAVILAIIILVPSLGYSLIYANSKIVKNEEILPEWRGNFSNIIENGIRYFVGFLLFIILFSFILSILASIAAIICFIISAILVGPDALNSDTRFYYAVAGLTILGLLIFMVPLLIIFTFVLNLAVCSFLTDIKIISFFNLKKMFSLLKGNFLNLLLIILFSVVISVCNHFLFRVVPLIFFIITTFAGFYLMLVFYNLYAQFVQIGMKNQLAKTEEQTENGEKQE